MKILHLTLKKKWFDLIGSGEKVTEYREVKPHWNRILKGGEANYGHIKFVNGYGKHRPYVRVELLGISIIKGSDHEPRNGEPLEKSKSYYALQLGSIIFKSNHLTEIVI